MALRAGCDRCNSCWCILSTSECTPADKRDEFDGFAISQRPSRTVRKECKWPRQLAPDYRELYRM